MAGDVVPGISESGEGDTAPLLGADHDLLEQRQNQNPVRRTSSRLRSWCRGRWPLLIVVGAVCFVVGLAFHPGTRARITGKLTYEANPHIPEAVRVRVLNGLLEERYPVTGGQNQARHENWDALDHLASCLETNTCSESEEKVLILSSYHFGRSEVGINGGEEVWARSMITAFRELNYTILFALGHMDTLFIYQSIPDMVTAVLWEEEEWVYCKNRNESNYKEFDKAKGSITTWQSGGKHACTQSEDFPEGIPHWKSFLFYFWSTTIHDLGGKWMLAPEDYDSFRGDKPGHTYIGYSIEKRCQMYPTFAEREHRGLILAKHTEYFKPEYNYFHGMLGAARDGVKPAYNDKGDQVKFELMSTADHAGDKIDAVGVETVGEKKQKEWTEILARSKVLLGIGRPQLSPSPYYALCMGLPFINPIFSWDEKDPDDRMKWDTQQNALRFTDEPYVYHVKHHDQGGLTEALQRAVDNPIPQYIPPNMKYEAVLGRVREFLENDWHAQAKKYVAEHYKNATEWQYLAMDMPPLKPLGRGR